MSPELISTRDMAPNCAIRAYLVWDDAASQGRCFVIDVEADKTTELAEITEDHKRLGYGAAPVEVLSFRLFLTWSRTVQKPELEK